MGTFHERLQRKFQIINDTDGLKKMAGNYLSGNTFFIKGLYNPIVLTVREVKDPLEIEIKTEYELKESAIFYRMNGKYMLINAAIKERHDRENYTAELREIKVSLEDRKDQRIPIERNKVHVSNIRATKQVISSLLFNVPTSIKVYFKQYENVLSDKADDIHVEVFDKKTEKFELVRKSGKMLYISDTTDEYSYMSDDHEKFIDYRNEMESDINKVIHEYKSKKIVSELIVPINYVGHDGKKMSIGYIQLVNKKNPISIEMADEIKEIANSMIDKVREANAVYVHTNQIVRNISKRGLQLLITDAALKKNLIQQKGFSFDIIFGVQKPISVFSEIAYFGTNPANDVIIGVKITGFAEGEKESKRYLEFIDALTPKTARRRN
ncbi:MAG: DUF1577 domain-containing protein [Spirochaetia bacterium]|nr:DUF1577 domain-containing protein [Spirochaetia bacterium]